MEVENEQHVFRIEWRFHFYIELLRFLHRVSWISNGKRTRREVNERQVQSLLSRGALAAEKDLSGRDVQPERKCPYELRSQHQFSGGQEQLRRSRV
ncbi:hypothetical protein TNCT_137941 [Trichonephila clavata]|uniref:Uncharacterized protein n=1 Tax=Trichonephila clavata TaxID=2740835 RepID=A0A8X6IUF5_TRICU|nr:hypothetical protein TNCT_137941 [Trichonephila clavata]